MRKLIIRQRKKQKQKKKQLWRNFTSSIVEMHPIQSDPTSVLRARLLRLAHAVSHNPFPTQPAKQKDRAGLQ